MQAIHANWTRPRTDACNSFFVEDFDIMTTILSALKWREKNGTIKMVTDSAGYEFYNVQEHLYLCRVDENNYRRRKSWQNCKNGMLVYRRHLKRGGCNLAQYIEICLGEIIFFLLPYPIMKYLSDKILRSK